MILLANNSVPDAVDNAFLWIGAICLVLLIGITATMVGFMIRYRHRPGRKVSQVEGNTVLEISWIVIPTLIVLFMFWKGYEGFRLMRNPPSDALRIKVVAQKWFWTFEYPQYGVSSSDLYVPAGKPIRLDLTAEDGDVVHSLYLPDFRIKEDCVPGMETFLWFQADEPGLKHNIFCAEFCGEGHAQMTATLHVLEADKYEARLLQLARDMNKPVTPAEALDPASKEIQARDPDQLFRTFCASCHGRKGRGGLVEGARSFTDPKEEWKKSPKLVDVFETLTEGVDKTQMRPYDHLPPWDRLALAHRIRKFSTEEQPQSTLDEVKALIRKRGLDKPPEVRRTLDIEKAMELILEEGEAR